MPIGKIILEIEIAHAQSLKDRRQVVRSMKDKLRRHFNVSVAELDEALVWNRASLGLAAISASTPYLRGQLEQIEKAAHGYAAQFGAEIIDIYAEMIDDGADIIEDGDERHRDQVSE
jgi:uncharacterized protein YlxP (DUF503 family)